MQDIHNISKALAHQLLRLKPKQGARGGCADNGLHNTTHVNLHNQAALIKGLHAHTSSKCHQADALH
jgi:hypothetical protein